MSAGTSIFLVIVGMSVAIASLYVAAIIDAAGGPGKRDKERKMRKDDVIHRLANRLDRAAPSAMPESTIGIAGGKIDWDKFAAAVVEAVEELLHADSEEQAEETVLQRVYESGKGGADT